MMDGGVGGGAGSPEQRFRGGAAPELAKSAAPGLGSACCLAVGGVRDVCSPTWGVIWVRGGSELRARGRRRLCGLWSPACANPGD